MHIFLNNYYNMQYIIKYNLSIHFAMSSLSKITYVLPPKYIPFELQEEEWGGDISRLAGRYCGDRIYLEACGIWSL